MTNWWKELEPETETEKRLQAEINRLREINAVLRAACEEARKFASDRAGGWALTVTRQLDEAIALDSGADDRPGWRLPGLE